MIFLWDDFNREHIGKHGVDQEEAVKVIENAMAPFPKEIGGDKFIVMGPDRRGRIIEVVFTYKS